MRAKTLSKSRIGAIRRGASRFLVLWLCGTLSLQSLWSQSAPDGDAPPRRLQIRVLTPVPMTEPAGALSANRIGVQVLDEWGRPAPRATVSFRLPEAGPGGAFLNGLFTEVVIANQEGRAEVQGFDWREEAGSTFIHVIAAYGEVRAGAMVEIQLGRKTSPDRQAALPALPGTSTRSPRSRQTVTSPESRRPVDAPAPLESQAAAETPAPSRETQPRSQRLGQLAQPAEPNAAAVAPVRRAPREAIPAAPEADYQAPEVQRRATASAQQRPEASAGSQSYVTVKQNSGGGNKALLFLLIAGAAAGGAIAAGMAGGSSSSSTGTGSTPAAPAITIGNPTITVSGGN